MRTISLSLFLFVTLSSASAFACSLAPEGWSVHDDTSTAAPEGPFVIPVENYYSPSSLDAELEVLDSSDAVVPGRLETYLPAAGTRGDQAMLIWYPDAPLDPSNSYTATPTFDGPTGEGFDKVALLPSAGGADVEFRLASVRASEYATTATQECCEHECLAMVDTCAPNETATFCETCWSVSFDYQLRIRANIEVVKAPTARYRVRLEHLTAGGQEQVDAAVVRDGEDLSLRELSVPSDDAFSTCVRAIAVDRVTGDEFEIGEGCIEDEAQIERSARDESPQAAPDRCTAGTFTAVDEDGNRTPISDDRSPTDESGCSSAGALASPAWLVLLVAAAARRRHRRDD